jgi:hypothetical protein
MSALTISTRRCGSLSHGNGCGFNELRLFNTEIFTMAANTEACHSGEGSKVLNRLPQLAEPLLQFDLREELEQLRRGDSWQRETGRSSKTLAKYTDFRIILVLMKAKTQMVAWYTTSKLGRECVLAHRFLAQGPIGIPMRKCRQPSRRFFRLKQAPRISICSASQKNRPRCVSER